MGQGRKKSLSIQSLEIKIDNDSNIPHIILNGIDFKAEKIGLKGLKIVWGSKEDEVPETLIKVDYMQLTDKEIFQEISIAQSFPGSLLSK
ncbi:Uncharacterised protein [Streptococcus equi subsp. equi]|uniref:hypothetical protein n=1 Tax=Streptococcus TaxID=1301 RepID=UPI00065187E3|nr:MULTISPECIES: hypothetical protein [Streptococcus]QBX24010.1 hypothetical protein Javan172_0007 [Streptococcus phage Javan172]HEL0027508.1 hypothetical protein [Streptococcus equi subsp. zooepidemicus]CRS48855.1 Uncharacterised protein [Streptococcus equi subsp. equi]CRS50149.1 Uncharacterised protein [Streptococcus equi subsp. equi]CRS67200.1 Uncharacterised protein [Streptococcus equi subsp. equi]